MSNWTNESIAKLRELCAAGVPNPEIAAALDMPISKIYAKRSQLGITIDKCKAAEPEPEEDAATHAWHELPRIDPINDSRYRKVVENLELAIEGLDSLGNADDLRKSERWMMQGLSCTVFQLRGMVCDAYSIKEEGNDDE